MMDASQKKTVCVFPIIFHFVFSFTLKKMFPFLNLSETPKLRNFLTLSQRFVNDWIPISARSLLLQLSFLSPSTGILSRFLLECPYHVQLVESVENHQKKTMAQTEMTLDHERSQVVVFIREPTLTGRNLPSAPLLSPEWKRRLSFRFFSYQMLVRYALSL